MHFEGWRYELGDFTVCVGRATLKPKQEFKGFVVDIHYHPLDDISAGQPICTVRTPSAWNVPAASPLISRYTGSFSYWQSSVLCNK